MAFVYWITNDLNANIKTAGYVGITSKTVVQRLKSHKNNYKRFCKSSPNTGCIKLYKEVKLLGGWSNVFIKTICESTLAYCQELEQRLRPIPNIGWNIRIGGDTPLMQGRKLSEESKLKLVEVRKKWVMSEASRQNLSLARQGAGNPRYGVHPWLCKPFTDLSRHTWQNADRIYDVWLKCGGIGVRKVAPIFKDLNYWTIDTMIRKFKKGWIPIEDVDWLKYKGIYE